MCGKRRKRIQQMTGKEWRGAHRRGCRGSFTVEAAFLYPILILLIAFLLTLSIHWYENVQETAEDTQELRELDTRDSFLENIGQILSR